MDLLPGSKCGHTDGGALERAPGEQEGVFRARHGRSRPRCQLHQGRRPQPRRGHPPRLAARDAARRPSGGSLPCVEHVPHRVGPREPSALDLKFKATTALPYDHLQRATASPRAELREKVAAAQAGEPDWATLAVDGPWETTAAHRRKPYKRRATVWSRRLDSGRAPSALTL